jgi:transcriptional regulator with XRE-family HTH domain
MFWQVTPNRLQWQYLNLMIGSGRGLPMSVFSHKGKSDMVDNIAIGNKIRRFRLQAGFTQERLADVLEITFQQVQKYERGITKVNLIKLQQLAEALKVPASAFFEESPYLAYNLTEQEFQLLEAFRELQEKDFQNCLLQIAECLKRKCK